LVFAILCRRENRFILPKWFTENGAGKFERIIVETAVVANNKATVESEGGKTGSEPAGWVDDGSGRPAYRTPAAGWGSLSSPE
jgi:hypothetical protein